MATTQSQADKSWQDSPSTSTPIMAADLKAMSKQNRDYRWMVPLVGGNINATVATATSSQGGNPAAAFDGSILSDYEAGSATVPQWVQAQLTTAIAVSVYTIAPRSTWYDQAPRDWTLQGSNDGTTFTVLDTRTGVTFTTDGALQFSVVNSFAYLYYRLNVTAINGSSTRMSIGEITLAGKGSMLSIDEFDDDTLDPAWVRADGTGAPSANVTWTERGDALSLYNAGGDSTGIVHAILRPVGTALAVGDAFMTSIRAMGGNLTLGGLVLSDSAAFGSGTQVLAAAWDTGGGLSPTQPFTATNWASLSAQATQLLSPGVAFIRLVMVAVGSWRMDTSPDGISWVPGTSFPKTVTPTHVGLTTSTWGTGNKHVITYEFLRRVSGVS